MRKIADDILASGQSISDDDLVLYILGGSGTEFESVVVNLTSRTDSLSLSQVQFALQPHEMRIQQQLHSLSSDTFSPTMAHIAAKKSYTSDAKSVRGGFSGRGRGRGRYPRGGKPLCQLCGKPNHVASKCYRRFDVSFQGLDAVSPTPHQAHVTSANNSATVVSHVSQGTSADSEWLVDSGATNHVTVNLHNLAIHEEYLGKDKVFVGQDFSQCAAERGP